MLIEEGGQKIVANQGALEDNMIIVQTHDFKEVFDATAKLLTHKKPTVSLCAPTWLFFGSSLTLLQVQLKICNKVMSSCDDLKTWCNKGSNVTTSSLDSIKRIGSNFETSDDSIIRKMLVYSNFYREPQITRSLSVLIAEESASDQNSN